MLPRLAVITGAVIVAALAAELVLPYVRPNLGTLQPIIHHFDETERYVLLPDIEIEFSGMFEPISPPVLWRVNVQGLRADEPVAPADGRYRIATYGDSEAFGWSVATKDTLQRRMEKIDERVQVLNFGIPGYNAENVVERIATTAGPYAPDHVVYLVNKNDVDPPIEISERVLRSELLLRLRFVYQVVIAKPWRKDARSSAERYRFLADQLDRIAAQTADDDLPLLLVMMKSRTWAGARANARPGGFVAGAGMHGDADRRVVDVEELLDGLPRLDRHLGPEAYATLAAVVCREIAGGDAGACTPHGWQPPGDHRLAPVARSAAQAIATSHAP